MKKKFLNITMMILLVLALSSIVSSELIIKKQTEDFFSGSLHPAPLVCLCGEFLDEVIIRNTAPYPQVFELNTDYEKAIISVTHITLKPDQEIKIPIMIRASCDEKPRTEEYNVFIKSTIGVEQIIKRNLDVRECQTITAELYIDKNETNICEPVKYSLKLKNPAPFTEKYVIGPKKNVEWFDELGYEVTLGPGQKSVLEFVFLSACEISGEKNNVFRVEAQRSGLSAELEHELLIKPGYGFTLQGPEEINTCREEIVRIPYTIINNGLIKNDYEIRLSKNPDFVELSNESFSLEPTENQTIHLKLSPDYKTKDEYDFKIITNTKIGRTERVEKNVNLTLRECHDASLTIQTPETLKVCQGTQELIVSLKNKGEYEETYELKTNTPTAVLENEVVTLKPEETKNIKLIIDSSEFTNKILFEVEAHAQRELLKSWEDTITLDIAPLIKCSEITFPWKKTIRSRYYEDNITIRLRNIGIETSLFTINYEGTDFLEIIENETKIEPRQYYDLVLNKTRENETDEYYFSLELISEKGETYTEEFRLKITSTPITEELMEYTKENPCFAVSIIILLTILIFLIILIIKGPILGKKTRTITTLVIIALVIISTIIYGLPQKVNPNLEQPEDPYEHKMYEGEKLILNMKDYVEDPDGDPLTFILEDEPTNITIKIEEELVKITSNWVGLDRFRITAKDGRSGEVTTPRFNIDVKEKTKLGLQRLYEFYCVHLNIMFLLILGIIVFFSGNKKIKESKKKTETKKSTPKKTKKTKKSKKKK